MSAARGPLPPPDSSGTDPDQTLKQRFSLGQPSAAPAVPVPGPFSGTGLPGATAPSSPRRAKAGKGTRPDPEGMRRVSYYISAEAADEMDTAVNAVLAALGDLPKHAVLSALVRAGAAQSGSVAATLAEARAAELTQRLEQLRGEAT